MILNHLSIKKKLNLAMISAVLFSTALVGILSQQQARKVIDSRLLESEIPATLLQIRNQMDKVVSLLQAAAQQLATNPLV
ncbi:methyl-accepting chemotaxis protein, partial [Photobacterium damselae]